MGLIDRDELLADIYEAQEFPPHTKVVKLSDVAEAAVVDAVPVVHGEWLAHNYGTTLDPYCVQYYCSKCNQPVDDYGPNYCPNCGAKMDGGNNYGI